MLDTDSTLNSPIFEALADVPPLLCLSIVWHPDENYVGAQYLAATEQGCVDISRNSPLFRHPGQDGNPIGHRALSRAPLKLRPGADGNLYIDLPDSRMKVELNGEQVHGQAMLSPQQIADGAILGLGGVVVLCLHWMRCLPKDNPVAGLIGISEAAIRTRDLILSVAPTDCTVLLLGETGSGKEVAARAIHALSRRAQRPMLAVNLAALSEGLASAELFGTVRGAYTGAHAGRAGLFSQAQDATLFLDEIGSAPPSVQPMLLRVLDKGDFRPLGAVQDMYSNARLIAATDQDLYGGSFNQALLRRLESFVIAIAPLRQRREDIGLLILHFLRQRAARICIPTTLVAQLANYDWPGNVRQLGHVLARCILALQAGEFPDVTRLLAPGAGYLQDPTPIRSERWQETVSVRRRLAEVGDDAVLEAMMTNAWNIQAAARTLGVSRPSMYKLLDGHRDIRRPEKISTEEVLRAFLQSGHNVDLCASLLKTPGEALRRHLHRLGLLPHTTPKTNISSLTDHDGLALVARK